jgi:hypothetical protein
MPLFYARFSGRREVYNRSSLLEALELPRHLRSFNFPAAGVAELADALDSKSSDRKIVWVRAPPPASLLPVGKLLSLFYEGSLTFVRASLRNFATDLSRLVGHRSSGRGLSRKVRAFRSAAERPFG